MRATIFEAGFDTEIFVSVAGERMENALTHLKNHAVMNFLYDLADKVKAEMFRLCNVFTVENFPPQLIPEERFVDFERQCFIFTAIENILELSDKVQEGVECLICLKSSTEDLHLFLNRYRTCGTESVHAICGSCMPKLVSEETQSQTIAGGQFQWDKCIYCRSSGKYYKI